jgi:hypothetical protein
MQNFYGGKGPMMWLWMLVGIVLLVALIIWIVKQTKS